MIIIIIQNLQEYFILFVLWTDKNGCVKKSAKKRRRKIKITNNERHIKKPSKALRCYKKKVNDSNLGNKHYICSTFDMELSLLRINCRIELLIKRTTLKLKRFRGYKIFDRNRTKLKTREIYFLFLVILLPI